MGKMKISYNDKCKRLFTCRFGAARKGRRTILKRLAVSIRNRVSSESILLMLRQAGKIDAFFYASVTAEYLTAALDAI
ncbi:MAG: hypothetical protein ACI4CC_06580 [Lachnospiraceae bacterium]